MGRRLGLIIGINTYQDAAFRPLQFAEMDARALAQWLVNDKGGKWSPADVQYVQGAYATRELIEPLFTQLCVDSAVPGDIVFIYFAGHAFLDERSGDGYLALSNTLYAQPTTGIHFPTLLQQAMGQSRASSIIFLCDYYQSGKLWSARRTSPYDASPLPGPALLNTLSRTTDRLLLCSCRGNEFAPETGEKSLGTFVHRMIVGLCGSAGDPGTRQITLSGLNTYLVNTLSDQQRPQLFGQIRTPVVLVGEMPASAVLSQLPGQSTGQNSNYNGSGFVATVPQSPPVQTMAVASGTLLAQAPVQTPFGAAIPTQASPTTTGQLNVSAVEQQISMLLRQARHLIQMHNPGEAFKSIEQVLQIDAFNIEALILKAQLLGTVGRYQEALLSVDRILQLNPQHALAWSLRAALLSNLQQYQPALQAIERSLELDPNNPETYALKTRIMDQMATIQSQQNDKKQPAIVQTRGGASSFLIGATVQFFGLILGGFGSALPLMHPGTPAAVALFMQSLGLAIMCVNSARGAYLYGITRVFLTLFTSLLAIGIAGGLYKFGLNHFYTMAQANPPVLIPILFLGAWLGLAAALPFVLALGGFIGWIITKIRARR
jgi:tetratricopeptide (TPR) repeat protein